MLLYLAGLCKEGEPLLPLRGVAGHHIPEHTQNNNVRKIKDFILNLV
jgi:hypothetical protein